MRSTTLLLLVIVLWQSQRVDAHDDQHERKFDSIFYQTYMNIAATDPEKALKVADSLFKASQSDLQRIRSLMLISNLYHRSFLQDSTVFYALKANEIAARTNNIVWQARIYGELSTQHRKYGLVETGRKFLDRGLEVSQKIQDSIQSYQFQGHVYQEKAYYEQLSGNYSEGIDHLKRANSFFLRTPQSARRATFMAQSHERMGKFYLHLNELDSAQHHFLKGLELEQKASPEETVLKGFLYNGLGLAQLENQKMETAYQYLCRALDIAEASKDKNLQLNVFRDMARYYKEVNDLEIFSHYNHRYQELLLKQSNNNLRFADDQLNHVDGKLNEIRFSRRNTTYFLSGILLLGVLTGVFYHKKVLKTKRTYPASGGQDPASFVRTGLQNSNKNPMSQEVENRILEKLESLEQSDLFLQNDISLPVLAARLQTNTNYVSFIINKFKGTGFNAYINEIRVKRFIEDLKQNPKLGSYKIAFLAEQYGFSSHSKFTATFRALTGKTPSSFLSDWKKETKQQENWPT